VTMWEDIAINNAKVTSSFKHGPSLVSFNIKLVWSSTWRSLMVKPYQSPPPSCCTKHALNFNHIQICWFLGYTTFKTFDKTNIIMDRSLTCTRIHMPSESWIRHIAIHHIDSPM
jgi:hypothetical protein